MSAGRIADTPRRMTRGVSLGDAGPADGAFLERLVDVLADLRYDALFLGEDGGFLLEPGGQALARRCADLGIRLLPASAIPQGAIRALDGPSFLDWEHRSREEGYAGAVVEYGGAMNAAEMGRSGFLYNMAYSARLLLEPDYDNFAWEKVSGEAAELAWRILRRLDPEEFPSIPEEADVYPVPVEGGGRARVGETARAVVFLHALLPGFGAAAGGYVVRYRDGPCLPIPLIEDGNIGRADIAHGRRYDPLSRAFVTDGRLRSLSCFTRPRLTMGPGGRPEYRFEYEWFNPRPAEPIEEILPPPGGAGGECAVRVHEVRLAQWGGKDERL